MKQTIIDQIEVTSDGHINVRMKKQIIDGNEVYDIGFHRTRIEVGGDVDAQIALVNAHLGIMGMGAISAKEITEIKNHATVAFTAERIAAHEQSKLLQAQAEEIEAKKRLPK